jgi:hypothetical protein
MYGYGFPIALVYRGSAGQRIVLQSAAPVSHVITAKSSARAQTATVQTTSSAIGKYRMPSK